MTVLRKVPARAGVQWVLGSLLLLRHAPLALSKLGALWGLAIMLVLSFSTNIHALAPVGPYLIVLASPLFMGGLLWAVREVDYGRTPHWFHLLAGVYGERPIHLLLVLFPKVMASMLLAVVVAFVLETDEIQHIVRALAPLAALLVFKVELSPEQIQALMMPVPGGNLLLWLGWAGVLFGMLGLIVWVMLPLVMFENINGVRALRYSFYACGYNLGAMGVCALTLAATVVVIHVGLDQLMQVFAGMIGAGPAMLLSQLALIAVVMPLVAGTMYAAWKHMLSPDNLPPPPLPRNLMEA